MESISKQSSRRQGLFLSLLIVSLLLIDQASKVWVKTSMMEGEKIEIFSWFRIYFIENEGMAYGITLGNKLFLTLFRLIAMSIGSWYLYRVVSRGGYPMGFLVCLALIIAGGWGNIIDCVFYGEIFTSSVGQVADFVPWGMGYGELLHGKVVDMLSFPLIQTTYPDWFPFWGGEPFVFFGPIFNFADSCISVGVFILLLCYPRTFSALLEGKPDEDKEKDKSAR